MFVDIVSSEYDFDAQENFETSVKWNHDEVTILQDGLVCGKIIGAIQEEAQPLSRREIKPMDPGGSVEGKISVEWGGSDGNKVSASFEAEVHDDHGNYIEVEVGRNGDGTGKAEISVGHDQG